MVKKVALDTLEVEKLESSLPEIPLPREEAPAEETGGKPAGSWLTSKWWWISALALVMVIAAAGVSYWLLGSKKHVAPVPGNGAPAAAPLPAGPLTAKANDFIITLQDDKGKYLVMTCDLTFELSAGKDAQWQQNRVEARKIIYEILKKSKAALLQDPKSRSGLKSEIMKALSTLLGEGSIKAIYFTRFVVL
jgi:flagellar basal body-associated protein FliL